MTLLPQIINQPVTELAALPANELEQLQRHVEGFSQQLKACKERLSDAIALKYEIRTASVRQSKAKEYGLVRFDDESITVEADISKNPKWDQQKLSDLADKIRASGSDPSEFMTITYKVPESKYNAWPSTLREQFMPARTLNFGKQTFVLVDSNSREGK